MATKLLTQEEAIVAGRILIADDQATHRILLKARLSAAHYQVLVAPVLAEVAAMAAAEMPDLVLLDLGREGSAAPALIGRLRATPSTAGIAILALAAPGDRAQRRAALAAGADDVLSRHDEAATLLARIRATLRARHQEAEWAMRDETGEVLGFAEAAPAFEAPGSIALVSGLTDTAAAWRGLLASHLRDRIEILSPEALLDRPAAGAPPDLCVIDASAGAGEAGLGLIADLRSRATMRGARIVAVTPPGNAPAVAAALDLGADDAVEAPLDAGEMVLRLRAQMRRKARADRLRRQLSDGLRLAVTDPLTGLYNRRYALARLERIAHGATETGSGFAVMVLDLDRFKLVNDSHGHAAGDAVLVEVGRRLASGLREHDLLARLGGEEFLVVMPETGLEAARVAAERLRRLIDAAPFALPGQAEPLALTVSIGVALGGMPERGPVEAVVSSADRALFAAKAEGRNQVTLDRPAA